jgi:thioredoxin 1
MINYKNKIVFLVLISILLIGCHKNEPRNKPYDESANASQDIAKAQEFVQSAHVPLVIIFGANWCDDCQALSKSLEHGEYAGKISKEFKVVKVNVGNFDTNLDVAKDYGNPIEGGIPGAAILSPDKKVLYVTKPGELSVVRHRGDDGIYNFFKEKSAL